MHLLFHPSESFDPAPGCNAAAWADGSGKPSVIDSRLLHSCNHQQVLGYSSGFRIPACGWVPSRGSFPCRWDIQPLLSVSLLFELHRWENRSAIQPESGIRKADELRSDVKFKLTVMSLSWALWPLGRNCGVGDLRGEVDVVEDDVVDAAAQTEKILLRGRHVVVNGGVAEGRFLLDRKINQRVN